MQWGLYPLQRVGNDIYTTCTNVHPVATWMWKVGKCDNCRQNLKAKCLAAQHNINSVRNCLPTGICVWLGRLIFQGQIHTNVETVTKTCSRNKVSCDSLTFLFLSPPNSKCLHRLMASILLDLQLASMHSSLSTIFFVVLAWKQGEDSVRGYTHARQTFATRMVELTFLRKMGLVWPP